MNKIKELKEEFEQIKALVKNFEGKIEALKVEKEDKFTELKEAYKNGAVIEFFNTLTKKWTVLIGEPLWISEFEYRIKPEDKFAELKEAYKNGTVIQYRVPEAKWIDCDNEDPPLWLSNLEYRIKPKEKPKVGDMCKFWNWDENLYAVARLEGVIRNTSFPYVSSPNVHYRNAKKLTKEEAIELLFGKEKNNG